jgi:long-subunit fatty acid transport protein
MSCERLVRWRRWRPRAAGATLAAALLAARFAAAAPLDEPFVGGMSFSGPTSGNVAAVYWNPAALGLVRGVQVMITGSGRLARTRATLPGGQATATDLSQPIAWPLGPGGFLGVAWDVGADRFTIAVATYTPFSEQIHFPIATDGSEPTRYQVLAADLRNRALVPALSIRFLDDLRVGFAPGFMFSTGRLLFAESLDGSENPATAARYDIDSGQGLSDAKFSVTLGGGLYYKRRGLELGLAYSSRPIGGDVPGVEVAAEQTTVTLPGGGQPVCRPMAPAGTAQTTRCVFGDMSYRLPDIWTLGATVHPLPGLEVTAMVRWIWFHVHDRIDIRVAGAGLDAAGAPQHIVLYRGFQDVWDTRLRVAYWWRERVRIGAALRFETSAVPQNAVNASDVDGMKLEPMALAEVRLSKHLWLGGGYGVTFMRDVNVTSSVFDGTAAQTCASPAVGGDLGNPACVARLQGRARPSANGTYSQMVQDFGVTVTASF